MSHGESGGGGWKVPKKCHVLFEWWITTNWDIFLIFNFRELKLRLRPDTSDTLNGWKKPEEFFRNQIRCRFRKSGVNFTNILQPLFSQRQCETISLSVVSVSRVFVTFLYRNPCFESILNPWFKLPYFSQLDLYWSNWHTELSVSVKVGCNF